MKSIRNAFRWCLILSVAGVFATVVFFSLGPTTTSALIFRTLTFFVVGLPPIFVYYMIVSSQIKKHDTAGIESSIDSVYYLGFLITLTTLLASVISYAFVGFGGAKNAAATVIFIAMGFGLSLTATAFALWARVDLVQQLDASRAQRDPEDVINDDFFKLEEASRRLSTVLGEASSRFEDSLAATNTAVTTQVLGIIEDARSRLNEFVQAASTEVSSSQKVMTEAAASGMETIAANNAALHAKMSGVIDDARTSLTEFVKAASLNPSSAALSKAVAGVTASLEKASADLSALFASLEMLQGRASGTVGDLEKLSDSVRRVSESAAAMNDALGGISTRTNAVDLEPLRTGLAQLGERLQNIGSSAASAEKGYVAASETAVRSMRAKTEDLTEATERLSNAFVAVADELARSTTVLSEHLR